MREEAPRRVVVVAVDSAILLDVAGPLDVFAVANGLGGRYDVRLGILDPEPAITGPAGLRLSGGTPLSELREAVDTLVVAGASDFAGPRFFVDPRLVTELRLHAERSRRVASVCTGAFALAEAGLLSGRRATTHWQWCAALAQRHPDVELAPDSIFVRDGHMSTSAGVTAGIDLALALVEEDQGAELAREVARMMVVFLQRPGGQSQFSTWLQTPPTSSGPLRQVLQALSADVGADHSVTAMAARARLSVRQFTRVFTRECGLSPGQYVERARVDAARSLLQSSDLGVDAVARRCGFGATETMRRAFLRVQGITPGAYRRRFSSTVAA